MYGCLSESMDSNNIGGKGISLHSNAKLLGTWSPQLHCHLLREYCLPKQNDKWMSESCDMLISVLDLTVTCTTNFFTVGGDSSESSVDA
jgi:hypothetical protein